MRPRLVRSLQPLQRVGTLHKRRQLHLRGRHRPGIPLHARAGAHRESPPGRRGWLRVLRRQEARHSVLRPQLLRGIRQRRRSHDHLVCSLFPTFTLYSNRENLVCSFKVLLEKGTGRFELGTPEQPKAKKPKKASVMPDEEAASEGQEGQDQEAEMPEVTKKG